MGDEFQVNTYITDKQARPTVSAFNNNGFVVTWRSYEQDGSDYGIYGQLFNGTGVKMGEEFQVNNYTSGDQSIPSMSVFSNDDFIVVWHSNGQDGSNYGVFGRLFNGTGAKKGEEFQVNSHTSNSQSQPSVSVFPNNDFVVTWHSHHQDGSSFGVYGQLFNRNGTKIGNEFPVNTYIIGEQSYPSVSVLPNNNFVVTWMSNIQNGLGFGIYGQLFNGTGGKIGEEFQVNNFTSGDQTHPSVSSYPDGNFIVTWQSDGQDGGDIGVFGRLYSIKCYPHITTFPTVLQVFKKNNIQKSSFPLVKTRFFLLASHDPITIEFALVGLEGKAELKFDNTRNDNLSFYQNNTRLVINTHFSAFENITSSISIIYHQTLE
eukprot:CAMPEP_0117424352 /NCGR_PEP_ID=MMETSP0758-20121206/4790_1 /TAXON_ID=63605 /ORGANISM="Percolomonas cosmopolitus, Strain AE-1 (ATCC 50343)" /LENGTH=372 /DNA_ID=CAMNT_0005208083 /DNA_START=504 /DNA_END=1619 /DNA_ORIENTATION=+